MWASEKGARWVTAISVPETRDCCAGRRGTLAANHFSATAPCVVDDDRHIAAGAVEMRFDDLQCEGGRNACVEGVAATLEHPHADRGRDPVGARDNAEGSLDFGPCRE
jgi:hypothetical protein